MIYIVYINGKLYKLAFSLEERNFQEIPTENELTEVITEQSKMSIILTFVLLSLATVVMGHGRLTDPPSRSTAHRYGFNVLFNDMDHQLNCGGTANQWVVNHGRCGVCGDPYQGPRENEAGGKYATGTIVRSYKEGQQINAEIEISAPHGGWSEFRLCPNNDVHKAVTQQCLDQYLLASPSGNTRIVHQNRAGKFSIPLVLPPGLTCTQCVLQWKWNTAHDYNCDPVTHQCCKGCGPQEQFYGCADVSIEKSSIGGTGSISRTTKLPFRPIFARYTKPNAFIPIDIRSG